MSPLRSNALNIMSPGKNMILSPLVIKNKVTPINGSNLRIAKPMVIKKTKFNSSMSSAVTTPTASGMSDIRVKKINFAGSNTGKT